MTGRIGLGSVVLGRYRLDEQVAAGGMGVLWRATDEVLAETVALKRVSFAHLGAEHADVTRERTLREARLAAKLRGHPNVVPLYDVQVDDGDVWLVLEYLPSRSLGQLLTANGPLDPAEAARIGASVAHALTAAHALGIQHRDVTPGNVLIGENGTVKLTDFGIAHSASDERITQTNAVVGTIAYLAPEVARGDDATSASDVFSLGATLYTAVEGQPPFGRHDNPVRMLNLVGSGIIRPPENAGPLTPLLLRMLELDPATRPDADTLHTQLGQLAARPPVTGPATPLHQGVAPPASGNGPQAATTGPPVPARSRRLAPLAGVLVAVALLAVVL
ncbi:MAG: protein kinase domain-containing protein, partial [Sciscionella sp.]